VGRVGFNSDAGVGALSLSPIAGAELAVVAARPEGAPQNVRGLSLYLVPRRGEDGQLNYLIRRLKDKIATRSVPTGEIELRHSEGWLLGREEHGIYLILEVLNLSCVANSVGSVALAQRAIADAYSFAQQRMAFGKPIIEHPLLRRQFEERVCRGYARLPGWLGKRCVCSTRYG
jgi:acyl-CoA dehydrogenase